MIVISAICFGNEYNEWKNEKRKGEKEEEVLILGWCMSSSSSLHDEANESLPPRKTRRIYNTQNAFSIRAVNHHRWQ